jgi:hypothetical protein
MIVIRNDEFGTRIVGLQGLFAPLTKGGRVIIFHRPTASQVILGLGPQRTIGSLRDYRHETRSRLIFLNYFEIWDALRGGAEFSLQKAYLHFDMPRPDGTGDREVLALHCDPGLEASAEAYAYKRGPHMHLPLHAYDLDRSHIALCMQNIELVCSDFGHFCEVMSKLVRMLDEEFLKRIEASDSG